MYHQDGTIRIEKGRVLVEEPVGLGKYPTLKPGKGVKIYLDNELITEEVVVFPINKIRLELDEPAPRKNFQIRLSEDKTKAYLKLIIEPGLVLEIKDQGPHNKLSINATIIKEIFPAVSRQEIRGFLREKKIVYGLQEEAIKQLVNSRVTKEVLIAQGKPAVQGKDAEVVPIKTFKKKFEDAFNFIDSFEMGEVIAYKKAAVPGETGINVLGERIEIPAVKDYELVAGKGVSLSSDGQKAIAISPGMPKIEYYQNKCKVSILPQYLIDGDIDKNTGNIKYAGDLIVTGNIRDYYDVSVGNNLQVHGIVANAEVSVRGDVLVKKNIISSKMIIGNSFSNEIFHKILLLDDYVDRLLKTVEKIVGEADKRKEIFQENYQLGRILTILLLQKYKGFFPCVKELAEELKKQDSHNKFSVYLQEFLDKISGYKRILQINDLSIFLEFRERISQYIEMQETSSRNSKLYASYIHNSYISATGDVIIVNKGCYNSTIDSGGDIIAFGRQGFLTGGSYKAAAGIFARKVASKLSRTKLIFNTCLFIQHLDGPVLLKGPRDQLNIDQERRNLYIKVDDEGKFCYPTRLPDISLLMQKMEYQQMPLVRK